MKSLHWLCHERVILISLISLLIVWNRFFYFWVRNSPINRLISRSTHAVSVSPWLGTWITGQFESLLTQNTAFSYLIVFFWSTSFWIHLPQFISNLFNDQWIFLSNNNNNNNRFKTEQIVGQSVSHHRMVDVNAFFPPPSSKVIRNSYSTNSGSISGNPLVMPSAHGQTDHIPGQSPPIGQGYLNWSMLNSIYRVRRQTGRQANVLRAFSHALFWEELWHHHYYWIVRNSKF